jgi:hypothetical protein
MSKSLEGKRGKKWDARRTATPHTIAVITRERFDSPEEALAGWRNNRCGLPRHINHWARIMKIKDLVLIIRQRESRSRTGFVDILALDLRFEPR